STSRNRSSITSLTFQGIALQLALNLLPMCLETSVTYVVGSYPAPCGQSCLSPVFEQPFELPSREKCP
ncbi:MAG: hypothetical protein ACLQBJ_07595, partial [Bryobacteraceae bacterium]